tara:strand:+ start:11415 stop:12176 length:762 start_codon:yes stop_codon:yes gene_type:complete
MADFDYFDGEGSGNPPHHFSTGQSHGFHCNQANTAAIEHELLVQHQIQQSQLLSPSQRHRHDSLLSYSPSSDSKSGGPSPQQAEVQPYTVPAQTTPHGYTQRPVNMIRSASQYSTNSSQYQQSNQHRASLGQGSRPAAVNMSRTSTQHSARSAGYHDQQHSTAPQPCSSQAQQNSPPIGFANSGLSLIGSASSEMSLEYNQTPMTADAVNSMYHFDISQGSGLSREIANHELYGNTLEVTLDSLFGRGASANE